MAPLVAEVPNAPQLKSRQIYIVDKPEARAVADSHRLGRRGALDGRLRGARGAEHHPRRLVHFAPQSEPAREERLQLRRQLGVRHAAVGRSVPGRSRRADRQDRSGGRRVLQRARLRSANPIPEDELAKAKNYVALGFPGEFETTGDLARKLEELVVYNLPEDTFANFVATVTQRDCGRSAAAGGALHPAGQDGGGGGRRSQGDRRADSPAQSRPDQLHHHRRTVSIENSRECSLPGREPCREGNDCREECVCRGWCSLSLRVGRPPGPKIARSGCCRRRKCMALACVHRSSRVTSHWMRPPATASRSGSLALIRTGRLAPHGGCEGSKVSVHQGTRAANYRRSNSITRCRASSCSSSASAGSGCGCHRDPHGSRHRRPIASCRC